MAATGRPSQAAGTVSRSRPAPSGVRPVTAAQPPRSSRMKQDASLLSPAQRAACPSSGWAGRGMSVGLLSPSIALILRTSSRVYTVLPLELRWKFVS